MFKYQKLLGKVPTVILTRVNISKSYTSFYTIFKWRFVYNSESYYDYAKTMWTDVIETTS